MITELVHANKFEYLPCISLFLYYGESWLAMVPAPLHSHSGGGWRREALVPLLVVHIGRARSLSLVLES
jgi:hypothetical protein